MLLLDSQAALWVLDDNPRLGRRARQHRFTDVTEDLTVLVVFGPAEYSRS